MHPETHTPYRAILGKQGCKNERDGGETVLQSDVGPFLVYYVFRSFQRPSDGPLMRGRDVSEQC